MKNKKKGSAFVEDILEDGKKISRMLFDKDCKVIIRANEYLWYLERTATNSYNSIKIYSNYLLYFYKFLEFKNLQIENLQTKNISDFLHFLKKIKVKNFSNNYCKKKYSIENSFSSIEFITKTNGNLSFLGRVEGLKDITMIKIFKFCIKYLKYLKDKEDIKFIKEIELMLNLKNNDGYLKAAGIYGSSRECFKITDAQLLNEREVEILLQGSKVIYSKLLFYLLKITGMRIGEALGLHLVDYKTNDLRATIRGDIFFENGRWRINIIYRKDSMEDQLSKGHQNRSIYLKKTESYTFELLLERYLKNRSKILKNKKIKELFISRNGNRLYQNTAYKCFKNILLKHNLTHRAKYLTLHSFRHSFITREIKNNIPIVYVSLYVGHSSIETTINTYFHITGRELSEIIEKYGEYINKSFDVLKID